MHADAPGGGGDRPVPLPDNVVPLPLPRRGADRLRGRGAGPRRPEPPPWVAPPLEPPPHDLYWLEPWRAAWELAASFWSWPLLHSLAPRGDGHPVLVLPGLVTNDASTLPLRMHLSGLGHDMHGWGLGWNLGPRRDVVESLRRLVESLHDQAATAGEPDRLEPGRRLRARIADERPDLVRCVVTLGTPFAGDGARPTRRPVYRWLAGEPKVDAPTARMAPIAPPVPSTSIYSRSDGIVAWRSSVQRAGPATENIEVTCSHMGLGAHPAVLYAVADRLAQPEGAWQPFDRNGWRSLAYPDPDRP